MRIYKKCEKTVDNEYGIIEINSYTEVTKPFLICMSSLDDDNSSFGTIKEGARAARVRTTDELAGGFKIDEMPVDFLGIKNELDGPFRNIVDDFLYPMITMDKDVSNMKKRARRINFFVYCNAAQAYLQIEKRLIERLTNDGFSEKDIKDILSQISLIAIATNINLNSTLATTVIFKDVNDREVYDKVSKQGEKNLVRNNRMSTIVNLQNGIAYIYYGNAEHSLKTYLHDESMVKPSLCATVCKLLENSIVNEHSSELVPISPRFLTPIILRNNGEFMDNKELLSNLDNSLVYYGASRYSDKENEELISFEESLKSSHGL